MIGTIPFLLSKVSLLGGKQRFKQGSKVKTSGSAAYLPIGNFHDAPRPVSAQGKIRGDERPVERAHAILHESLSFLRISTQCARGKSKGTQRSDGNAKGAGQNLFQKFPEIRGF